MKQGWHLNPKAKYCSSHCPLMLGKRFSDLVGQKFNRWTVIAQDRARKGRGRYWLCRCECGNESSIAATSLMCDKSKACLYCRSRKYFTEEATKEGVRVKKRRYLDKNPAKAKSHHIKYALKLGYATPLWLKADHWHEMDRFYRKARSLTAKTKVVHHVDHIVPLQGKTVCGLHVPWNLQVLTRSENCRKSNKFSQAA